MDAASDLAARLARGLVKASVVVVGLLVNPGIDSLPAAVPESAADVRGVRVDRAEPPQPEPTAEDSDSCASHRDCVDTDRCSLDRCVRGHCVHPRRASCCASHADCDDGDSSMADTCVRASCVNASHLTHDLVDATAR